MSMTPSTQSPRSAARIGRSPRVAQRRRRLGLSLMEAMISLTICSMLLVATGTAFTASANAMQANTDFNRASQSARVTMNQMLVEIRRADAVSCDPNGDTSYFDVIRPAASLAPNEVYRRYRFDAAGGKLTLQIYYSGSTSSPVYTLASNVNAATFGPPVKGTDANNTTVVQRVPIKITTKTGKNAITLYGSAGPRRALKNL
jgi:Tfp pilus assembly protein PilW